MTSQVTLVTGPTRSGKSEWAEHLAQQTGAAVVYVATAQQDPRDRDWQQRINAHRDRRPPHWHTREVPIELPAALTQAQPGECWLIDALGTWVANTLDWPDADWDTQQTALIAALTQTPAQFILVAEETGWGVVPAYPLGRQFRDRLGTLTRRVAAIANPAYLVVAGYAIDLRRVGRQV